MPSTSQRGIGVTWGISSTGFAWTGSAGPVTWTVNSTDQSISVDAAMDDSSKDPVTGATIGLVFSDFTREVQLKVYPKSTSIALALAEAVKIPYPGDLFVITDSNDAVAAGTYTVLKASRMRKVAGKAEFDVTLKSYENSMALIS